MQLAPSKKPAQKRVSPQWRTDAKAAEQKPGLPDRSSANSKTSKRPDKATARSKPGKTTTRSATPPRQDQQSSIAAEHQPAADFLISLGFPSTRVAYFFQRMPQLGVLAPAELQARLGAIAAAFGGKLSSDAVVKRVKKRPRVLTLTPGAIAASHARLADFWLTADEAARVLAAQPAVLLESTTALRSTARSLHTRHRLTPAQLRDVIISSPRYLLRSSHASEEDDNSAMHNHINRIAGQVPGSSKSARSKVGKVGVASFQ